MGIFIWDTAPSKIFVWDTEVSKVFVWDTQVRPTWWTPWANTVAYYEFDNNLNDSSGNWHNMSWYNTPSYWTTADWANYANFSGSNWTYYLNWFPYNPSAYTISFWMNYPSYSSGGAGVIIDYWYADGSNIPLRVQDKGSKVDINSTSITPNPSTNAWHYYTISYSSGTASVYLDGSSTWQTFSAMAAGTGRLILWNEWGSSYHSYHAGRWKLSEFIIESKTRTAQEISDYYNQTKWNYWL